MNLECIAVANLSVSDRLMMAHSNSLTGVVSETGIEKRVRLK